MPETIRSAGGRETTSVVGRTMAALRIALGRPDSGAVVLAGSLAYLLLYLLTIGDLSLVGETAPVVRVVDDLSRMTSTTGFFRFEPVAVVSGMGITYLFSPLNLVVAGGLAGLVGANLGVTYLGIVQPRACGLEASTGALAGVPALLSGAACCGPTILLLVGVQASAAWIGVFQLLVPLAFVLLVGSLLLVGRQVDPSLL